ncbi:MAG TPA: hypothetical protein VFO36_05250, partial [Nitrospiraceae bacterium]|nr:hypothetical protein [Nitrospiraceae bacterium]
MKQRAASWTSLLLCLLSVTSHAQDNTWIEDAHGCKFLHPRPEKGPPPEPLQWDGACVDGYLSGPGTASLGVQAVYTGEFKRGVMDSGEVKYRSVTYKGALRRNSPNGHGVWSYPNGWVVEGEVGADFKLIGVVDVKLPDGTHYLGGVREPGRGEIQRHGRGKLVGANGNTYEGDFQFDQPHGQGRATYAAGGFYVGQWAFGQYEGKGVYEGADGSRYEGDFLHGKLHGQVTMRNADGSLYVGQCVTGDRQGTGRLQYADGTV